MAFSMFKFAFLGKKSPSDGDEESQEDEATLCDAGGAAGVVPGVMFWMWFVSFIAFVCIAGAKSRTGSIVAALAQVLISAAFGHGAA